MPTVANKMEFDRYVRKSTRLQRKTEPAVVETKTVKKYKFGDPESDGDSDEVDEWQEQQRKFLIDAMWLDAECKVCRKNIPKGEVRVRRDTNSWYFKCTACRMCKKSI